MIFPTITNPKECRTLHAACWRIMAALKRQATVRDPQTKKRNLTTIALAWKKTTLGATAANAALKTAAETMKRDDLIAAYCAMGAFIGAVCKPPPRPEGCHSVAQARMLLMYGSTVAGLSRDFYKATACGGWCKLNADGSITIGSIVEGSDAEFSRDIPADATDAQIRAAVKDLEQKAHAAWKEANA